MVRRLHFWIFVAVVALAPLPLGSNRPWSAALLALAIGLLAATLPFVPPRDDESGEPPLRALVVPAVLFGLVLIWAGLQASPLLPVSIGHPIWLDAAGALPSGLVPAPRIAVDRDAALSGMMRLLCYAAAFWIAFYHGRSGHRAWLLIESLAIVAGFYAVYGLVAHYSGSETILWFRKWAYKDDLSSTFVNRNHYATYAGLGLIMALAAAAHRLQKSSIGTLAGHVFEKAALFAAAAATAVLAIPATGSRAGTAAACLGVLVLAIGIRVATRPPEWRAAALLIGAAVALPILVLTALLLANSADALFSSEDRLRIYAITIALIAERPILGHGLGSFPGLFAAARPETISQVWTQAHNSYLELALDLGIPAAICLIAAVAWLVGICLRGLLVRRRDRVLPAAGLASTVLVASHALLDFSVQIPAVAVMWMALLGVAAARSLESPRARAAGREPGRSLHAEPAPQSAAP